MRTVVQTRDFRMQARACACAGPRRGDSDAGAGVWRAVCGALRTLHAWPRTPPFALSLSKRSLEPFGLSLSKRPLLPFGLSLSKP